MLKTNADLLLAAQQGGYAVGAFNTNNLEITHAIMGAAQDRRAPVIVATSAGALKYAGIGFLSQIVLTYAHQAAVPVALHLDHGPNFASCMDCIRHGYSSVMIDASKLPFDENVAATRQVVEAAHAVGVSVEAELGRLVGIEDHVVVSEREVAMTNPDEAAEFVRQTGIDALAVAIGNAHGFYKGDPQLDFDRLRAIRERVDIPLVLHGASGIPDHDIRTAISLGICKINIDTEVRDAFARAVRQFLAKHPDEIDPRPILKPTIQAMQTVVARKIELFGSAGRG
ncbi:MAG: class II fructose-1,6-bisphosphate aldolase [Chloroflexi bacterium]|nr:class II fructose-1,6-bisphosphate aldolase [Chloroflexota bacterium]MBU1752079.1 class II fructose-1,6-bisphosphate aldolase [Chloroflexota bacterium]MBU1877639.1 class II fructose-1,6-bisphosphate aldolase [Chloroflexota bacterium]